MKRWFPWFQLVAAALLVLYLVTQVGAAELSKELLDADPFYVALTGTLAVLSLAIGCLKWGLILRCFGENIGWRQLFTTYFGSLFWGLLLPTSVGGDAFRIASLARRGVSLGPLTLSVLLERVSGLAGLGLIFVVLTFWGPLPPVVIAALIFVSAGSIAAVIFGKKQGEALSTRNLVLLVTVFSLAKAIAICSAYLACARAVGSAIPAHTLFAIVPLVAVARMIPLTPSGVGLGESALAVLFERAGHPAVHGVATGFLTVATQTVVALLSGVVTALFRPAEMKLPPEAEKAGAPSVGEFYDRHWTDRGTAAEGRVESFLRVARESAYSFAFERLVPEPGSKVLFVGAGDGFELTQVRSGTRIVAELSGTALQRLEGLKDPSPPLLVQSDAHHLPFASSSIDRAFLSLVLMHVDARAVSAELSRVLRPGGKVVIVEPLLWNPVAFAYRKFFSEFEEIDPKYLSLLDLRKLGTGWSAAEHREFYLFSPFLLPLALLSWGESFYRRIAPKVERFDRAVMSAFPPLRHFAWMSVTVLSRG